MATPKIFEAMSSVMDEIEAIGKDKKTSMGNGASFSYRGIDQVYNDLHPLLAKHKIFTTPKVLNNQREERTNKGGTTLLYSRVEMQYTFWTIDGSSVECSVIGEGMDSGDKATNKAMAIAHKYALLQTFCIPTEDMPDPDSEVHEVKPKKQEAKQEQPKAPTLKDYLRSKSFTDIQIRDFYDRHNIATAERATAMLNDKAALDELCKEYITEVKI